LHHWLPEACDVRPKVVEDDREISARRLAARIEVRPIALAQRAVTPTEPNPADAREPLAIRRNAHRLYVISPIVDAGPAPRDSARARTIRSDASIHATGSVAKPSFRGLRLNAGHSLKQLRDEIMVCRIDLFSLKSLFIDHIRANVKKKITLLKIRNIRS
jgi:hypothetical protein